MQVEDLKKKIGANLEKLKNPPVGTVIPVGIIENTKNKQLTDDDKQLSDDEWQAVDEANQMMTIPEQIQNATDLLVFNLKKRN